MIEAWLLNNHYMHYLLRIAVFFIDTKLFISLAAVGLCFTSCLILNLPVASELFVFIFLSTLLAYSIPWLLRQDITRFLPFLFAGMAVYSGVFLYLHLDLPLYILTSLVILLTLLYYIPVFRFRVNLRQSLTKPFVIAITWSLVTVVLPVLYLKAELLQFEVLSLLAERFVFFLIITIPFDIRDVRSDRQNGMHTFPVLLGIKSSLWLAQSLLAVYLFISFLHYGLGSFLIARIACVLVLSFLIERVSLRRSALYYTGCIDGTMILQSVFLYLAYKW